MAAKWIHKKQLRIGMFVVKFGGSWLEHPFWRTHFLLDSREDLLLLKKSAINRICIDVQKGLDVDVASDSDDVDQTIADVKIIAEPVASAPMQHESMSDELRRSKRILDKSKEAVITMFAEARMGKAIEVEDMKPLVEEIANSVARNSGALISLARLKNKDEYTYMHSVAVCALMIALARQLELSEELVREAGMAGLVHDIGKAMVPLDILNKPGRLTDVEFISVKAHPEHGYRLLKQSQSASDMMLDVCLHHHEKIDGSGYPKGLRDKEISLFAKMGAVCDVYDAITSNRPYKNGWDPAESLRRMAEWNGHFDTKIYQAFVKSLGIYPIGSLVRMESGKLGVVIEQHPKSLVTPKVKVFFSTKSRCQFMPEIIDLSDRHCEDKIVARESAEKWGLTHLDDLWNT